MQWVQDPSQSNVNNLITVRHAACRHFRNKKKAYLKAKNEELENNNKIKNIRDLYRGISDFKKGYQPRTNIIKDEKGDLVADSYSIVARWRNYFSQLLNVCSVEQKSIGLNILSPEPKVTCGTVAIIIRVFYFPHICAFMAFLCLPFITINHTAYILTEDNNTFA